jgi:uncharacterized protein (TIGR02246 family)
MTNTTAEIDDVAAEQERIAGVPARMIAAWTAHDADAFADLFVEDGTMILPGSYVKGRDEIREFMATAYASHYKGTTVTGRPIDLKLLGQGVVALLTTGGVLEPGETELTGANAIRASWILVKRGEDWKLAVYQNCARDSSGS